MFAIGAFEVAVFDNGAEACGGPIVWSAGSRVMSDRPASRP